MVKVIILGSGNVATQLAKTFIKTTNIQLVQIYARSKPSAYIIKKGIPITHDIHQLKKAAIYIIAISDDAISDFSKNLIFQNKLVVHTSGSIGLNELQSTSNKGVFYPLQSISKQKNISFKNIPICIEAQNKTDYFLLEKVAKSISNNVYSVNSQQRKSLHVAAVFVNNFTNHLYKIGNDICTKNKMDFDILKPLIIETANKIKKIPPKEVQTGPAIRKDYKTIKKHLSFLNDKQQKLYTLLTASILDSENK